MKSIQKALASFIFALATLVSLLPIQIIYAIARIFSWFAHRVIGYRCEVVYQNLSRAFPEKNYHEIQSIAHDFYVHFFDVFAEVVKSITMKPEEAKKRFSIKNPELVEKYIKKGINIIALTGHRGNWEWLLFTSYYFNCGIYSLYKPLSSSIMEEVMQKIRGSQKLQLLAMQKAGRYILRKKDYPALYFFISDQSPPGNTDSSHQIPFLHQPSLFFEGGAKLAKATKSAAVYISIEKIRKGYYEVEFTPISLPEEERSERDILLSYTHLLEKDIVNQPPYWLWTHKRWKHEIRIKNKPPKPDEH